MNLRYFEELAVGQKFTSPTLSVDADAITAFAAQFDPAVPSRRLGGPPDDFRGAGG